MPRGREIVSRKKKDREKKQKFPGSKRRGSPARERSICDARLARIPFSSRPRGVCCFLTGSHHHASSRATLLQPILASILEPQVVSSRFPRTIRSITLVCDNGT